MTTGGGGNVKKPHHTVNSGISRKQFLKAAVMGAAGMAFIPPLVAAIMADKSSHSICYSIRPIPGKRYSPSFLKFCRRLKFSSAQQAVSKVKNRRVGYLLVAQPG